MPKYKVQTDQGNFMVELDREPSSQDELNGLVQQHLSTPAPAPTAPDERSTLTKFAAAPSEAVAKIPYVGKAASMFVPSTPAGWGALAGLAGASALVPGAGFLPFAARAGGAALGAMGGSVAGGERQPVEIGKEGALAAGGQMLGEGVGKAVGAGAGYISRQLKGGTSALLSKYGDELAKIIPGVPRGKDLTPTAFFDVVLGGKGNEALDTAYKSGVETIKQQVGPNAFLQNPKITAIIRKYLPDSELTSNITTITAPIRAQGATAPAHLVLGGQGGQPVSVENALKAAQEIAARSRLASGKAEGAILGREMRQANSELRNAIADELNGMAKGTGDLYKQLNESFRRGITALEVLKDSADKIFQQGSTGPIVNAPALARSHNLSIADLERVGAGNLAAAARRGAVPGAGDTSMSIPGTGLFFGESGVRGRLSKSGLSVPAYAGQPGGELPPWLTGYAGQRTVEQLLELLRKNQLRNPQP